MRTLVPSPLRKKAGNLVCEMVVRNGKNGRTKAKPEIPTIRFLMTVVSFKATFFNVFLICMGEQENEYEGKMKIF